MGRELLLLLFARLSLLGALLRCCTTSSPRHRRTTSNANCTCTMMTLMLRIYTHTALLVYIIKSASSWHRQQRWSSNKRDALSLSLYFFSYTFICYILNVVLEERAQRVHRERERAYTTVEWLLMRLVRALDSTAPPSAVHCRRKNKEPPIIQQYNDGRHSLHCILFSMLHI